MNGLISHRPHIARSNLSYVLTAFVDVEHVSIEPPSAAVRYVTSSTPEMLQSTSVLSDCGVSYCPLRGGGYDYVICELEVSTGVAVSDMQLAGVRRVSNNIPDGADRMHQDCRGCEPCLPGGQQGNSQPT